jgi:hypothetical protein
MRTIHICENILTNQMEIFFGDEQVKISWDASAEFTLREFNINVIKEITQMILEILEKQFQPTKEEKLAAKIKIKDLLKTYPKSSF